MSQNMKVNPIETKIASQQVVSRGHTLRDSQLFDLLSLGTMVTYRNYKVWCMIRLNRRFGQWGSGGPERSCKLPLSRDQVALVVLSLADGSSFTPVQIQKALFLASDKVPTAFAGNSRYNFQPYDYGPFDAGVYSDVQTLERQGLAQINQQPGSRWRTYSASARGVAEGRRLAGQLPPDQIEVLGRISKLVRSLSFNDLVSAIYRAYPRMRERSVFRD